MTEKTLLDWLDARPRFAFANITHFAAGQVPQPEEGAPLDAEFEYELGEWQEKAIEGDAYAQWLMGRAAEKGWIAPAGIEAALGWYRQAAAQGLAEAINDLAVFEHRRCDPAPEVGEAIIAAYERAADDGLAEALCNLGLAFHHYRGFSGRARGSVFFEEAQAEGVAEAAAYIKQSRTGPKGGVTG
jgi:hypothetical protein